MKHILIIQQGLAKKLRCFGIDAEALETGESCDKCIEYYEKEKRVVLTKGSAYERLAKFIPSSFIYKVQKEVSSFSPFIYKVSLQKLKYFYTCMGISFF